MKKYNDQPENQSLPIRRIERQTIVEHVMENVRELIVSKRFKVGDKIPPETELARLFGIGRPTVREAIKVFQYLGIMESRPGTGTFICDRQHISAEALTWSILLGESELYEVIQMREVLEGIGLRNLASKNSEDPSSISQVTESLEREVENIRAALAQDDTEEIMRADYSLHGIIIEAANNSLFTAIYATLQALMYEEIALTYIHPTGGGYRADVWHREYVEAIKAGNLDAMLELLRGHTHGVAYLLRERYENT